MIEVSVQDIFSDSVAFFKKNMQPILLGLGIVVGVQLASQVILQAFGIFFPDLKLLGFMLAVATMILTAFFQAGFCRYMLAMYRGKEHSVPMIYSVDGVTCGNYIIANMMLSAIIFVGLILLIVPGIYLLLRFSMVFFYVVDRKMKALDALKESWLATQDQALNLMVLGLITVALFILGLLAFLVGVIPALGLIHVLWVAIYCKLSGSAMPLGTPLGK